MGVPSKGEGMLVGEVVWKNVILNSTTAFQMSILGAFYRQGVIAYDSVCS